jgi:hypothetical protein
MSCVLLIVGTSLSIVGISSLSTAVVVVVLVVVVVVVVAAASPSSLPPLLPSV